MERVRVCTFTRACTADIAVYIHLPPHTSIIPVHAGTRGKLFYLTLSITHAHMRASTFLFLSPPHSSRSIIPPPIFTSCPLVNACHRQAPYTPTYPLLCHPRKPLYILVEMFYNPSKEAEALLRGTRRRGSRALRQRTRLFSFTTP